MVQTASALAIGTDVVDVDTLARALLRGDIPADYAEAISLCLDDEFRWLWEQLSRSRTECASDGPSFLTIIAE
jgi:hypothetical protein